MKELTLLDRIFEYFYDRIGLKMEEYFILKFINRHFSVPKEYIGEKGEIYYGEIILDGIESVKK